MTEKRDRMFTKGLCSVSFRGNTPAEIVAEAKNAGISLIEWGSDVHASCRDTEKLKNIAELSERYGVGCSSYGTYFNVGENDISELDSYIDAAHILGTDTLRIWCRKKGSADYSPEEKAELYESCKRIADAAEKRNVTLCCECHVWNYTDEADAALELMRTVGSERFRMYWQPNQFRSFEDNLRYAEVIAGYVKNVHVFNWHGSEKFPLGEGKEIWKKYLGKLGGDRTLLLEFMPDDKLSSLLAEAESLGEIIKEVER